MQGRGDHAGGTRACEGGATLLAAIVVLLPRGGLTAVGWAYLAVQALPALAAVPFILRWKRRYTRRAKLAGAR